MRSLRTVVGMAAVAWLALGCAKLLPYERESIESPWESFEGAKAAFDLVRLEETNDEELRGLGFHPFGAPNVEILTFMDVYQRFVPHDGIRLADQDPGVQRCVEVRERCTGYRVRPKRTFSKRHGNFVLDYLSFRRQTETTGWEFGSLLVLVDGRVVYKLWEGNPSLLTREDRVQPLGPLQELNDLPYRPW
jgi:hypothetical protein